MKKKQSFALAIAMIVLLSAVSGCASIDNYSNSDAKDPKASGIAMNNIADKDAGITENDFIDNETPDGEIVLSDAWAEYANKIADLSIEDVISFSKQLWESGRNVTFPRNFFTSSFIANHWKDQKTVFPDSETISLKTNDAETREESIYLLFIATVTNCLEDCFYYTDYDYSDYYYNRLQHCGFYLSFDYKDAGYSNTEEYYNALVGQSGGNGFADESLMTFNFHSYHVQRTSDTSKNIYGELFDYSA